MLPLLLLFVALGLVLVVSGSFFAVSFFVMGFEELLGLAPGMFFAGGRNEGGNCEGEDGGLEFHGRINLGRGIVAAGKEIAN